MKKIGIREFAQLVEQDPALRRQLRACADTAEAESTLRRLAAEQGYELEDPRSVRVLALSDDDLGMVSGGVTAVLREGAGELNPYSWFVSFLRRMMGKDDVPTDPLDPDGISRGVSSPGRQ